MEGSRAELLVEEGVEKGRVLSLRPDKVIEIGREGNFRLEDPSLSRHHCRIVFESGAYHLHDEDSTYGTFLNGERVRSARLSHGDSIRVGTHVIRVALPAPGPATADRTVPLGSAEARALQAAAAAGAADADGVADEDLPSASPSGAWAVGTAPEPAEEPEEEAVPEGACANCRRPAEPEPGGDWQTESLGLPPRAYCTACREQYPLLGRVLANHFCERVLGAGGMGVVYRGVHVVMGRRAALKVLRMLAEADPVMVQRLLREATAGGRIQHPCIVAVHDTGEQDQVAYVVMEYVRGENLAEALRREKRFPLPRALWFAEQVADALAAGFRLGYIHRDIKPENILLTRGDRVKVTDFGLAKNLKEGELGGLTRTGQVLGTMVYIAPEQIVSSKGSDQRADIYSLGSTLFHLIAGRPPFDSKSAIQLLMQIRTDTPPALSSVAEGVPGSVDRIVARCLQKDPGARYQTPAELAADLRAARSAL